MKKYIIPVLLLLVMAGCSDDIESNTPSIQGLVNSKFFRATDASAEYNQDGSVTLMGADANQVITLTTDTIEKGGVYQLGENSQNVATFETREGVLYSTGDSGDGQIVINDIKNGALYGTVYFNARVNGTSGDTLNFNKGSFFGVPVNNYSNDDGDTTPPPSEMTCDEAVANTGQALLAYTQAQAGGSADDIQAACEAYKEALQNQIEACGDPNGILQGRIDNLDC